MKHVFQPSAGSRPRAAHGAWPNAARWVQVLALAVLAACAGDGTGSSPEPVASVTLDGVPTDVVLTGSTVQLTATPASASGTALPNRVVTWQSSDTAIATVGATGAVSVVGMGTVSITAQSEGKAASATLDARAGGLLGPDGGTLRLLDGRITVIAPSGGFQFPTMLLFRPATAAPASDRTVPGTTYEMHPYSMAVSRPPLLVLAYDPARLPAGVAEAGLQLYQVVDGGWRAVSGSTVDTVRNVVRGGVFFGGTYAVAGGAPSSVVVYGAPAAGAMYVGQTQPLRAAVLDARGDTLRGRAIAWASSDPSRATVDAAGNVTGLAAGTPTITATVEGVVGSAAVTVLARPAVSWPQGAEWATLQGNARHDGYVPASLDPVSFRELWVKTAGEGLRQVATGAGKVFVSTGLGTGTMKLTAFDAATGAVSWSRAFASAEMVSSPAFGNGRVYVLTSGPEGALWSLDAADGTVRFTTPHTDRHMVGPPVVAAGAVYIGASGGPQGGVHRFDAVSGVRSWQVPLPWMDGQTPAVADGRVLAYGIAGAPGGGGLTALNAANGSVAYTAATSVQAGVRIPVLGGAGNVLSTNGAQLASIRLPSGAAAWERPGSFAFLPAVGGGVVYAGRGDAVVAVRESDGSPVWTWTPPLGTTWGPPLVTHNLLFVCTQAIVPAPPGGTVVKYFTHAIDLATGKQVWSHAAGGFLALGADGTLFITSPFSTSAGTLTAIAVK